MKATGAKRLKLGAAIVVASLAVWSGAGLANHFKNFSPISDMVGMVRGQFPGGFKTKQNPQRVQLNAKVPVDIFSLDLTLRPNHQTPLHWHEGPVLISVSKGQVTEYGPNCEERGTFKWHEDKADRPVPNFPKTAIGDGFLDETQPHNPHFIRNTGTDDAVLRMVAIIPRGAQPFTPVGSPFEVACPNQPPH